MEPTEESDTLSDGIKELFVNEKEGSDIKQNDFNSEETNGTLAVKVMAVICDALSKDIDEEISNIQDLKSMEMDTVVKNITSKIVSSPNMVCIQENINNIIETCTQELITEYPAQNLSILGEMQHFGNSNIMISDKVHSKSVSPILQPFQYVELAHNITSQKPSFIRIQAFEVLLSSQLVDAVSSIHWPILQKSLQSSLIDDHYDIFHLCIRVHAKLIARTSPDGIKESFLNILESLCQHYYTQKLDCNEINSLLPAHYRVIRLTNLMLDCVKEIAQSLPRLGEKHLLEMIDNFIHLISIHSSSSQTEYSGFNILDVVSCLDPNANWFKYISYNAVCRRIMFMKMSQNFCLLRIIINEILDWFNKPVFAEGDPRSGNLNKSCCKFAKFIHCLSLVSRICTYESGRNLFPVALNKDDEPIKIQKITLMVLKFLNRQQLIEEKMEIIFSDLFIKFLINSVEDLVSIKDTASNYTLSNILHVLFEPLSEKPELPPQHTVSIIESLCDLPDGPQNYFFRYGGLNKRRNILFNSENNSSDEQHNSSSSNFTAISSANITANENRQIKESKINNIEKQILTMKSAIDSFAYYSFCPVKIVTNVVVTLLTTKQLRDMTVTAKLVNVCCKLFQLHEGITILESNKSTLIHHAATVYQELIDIINNDGFKVLEERNFYLLFSSIEKFIIVTGTTPLGFQLVETEQRMVTDCINQQLNQLPKIGWQQPKWRLFVTFAAFNKDCADVLGKERDSIFKDVLVNLWSVLETSFETDSSILLDEAINYFMVVVATISISLKAVNAIFQSTDENGDDNNDEIDRKSDETVTETTALEVYPLALAPLILRHALQNDSFNYKVHEISLSALDVLVSTNIDNMLWLQNRLNFQEKLLQLQSDNRVTDFEEDVAGPASPPNTASIDDIIVDECGLLRHEILEKIFSVGPLMHNTNSEAKLYFTPPPLCSQPSRTKIRPRTYIELGKFLQDTRNGLHDVNWIRQARKAYRAGGNDEIKCTLLMDLVEQVQRALSNSLSTDPTEGLKWVPNESAENVELFPEDYIGIQLAMRYGIQHKLIQTHAATQASENLVLLLKLARLSLFGEQNLPKQFTGFDWFLTTIYLVCSGNVEKCQSVITSLTTLPGTMHVWDQYGASIGHSTAGFGHTVEIIAKAELPQLFHALVTNGVSWWRLCSQWIRECFWRMLEWNQVCHWLTFVVLHQPDYIVYFCVSILHHSEQRVLEHSNNATLWKMLINPPEKFTVLEHISYMDKLWKRHHTNVLASLETHQ